LQSGKKTSNKYITLLVMFDASSDPKSYRLRTSRLKLLIGGVVASILLFFGTLIYYYGSAYKIFYYDDLQKKYDQLASDNKRIKQIERQYRQVKQENEKIRLVFGMLGGAPRDSADTGRTKKFALTSQKEESEPPLLAEDNGSSFTKATVTGVDQETRFMTADYLVYARTVPSVVPVNSRFIARGFSFNKKVGTFLKSDHLGVDIVAAEGAPVKAAADGWVVLADWLTNYGNTIILYHGFGYFTVYKHIQYLTCKENTFVKGNDIIATVGKTGLLATGTHLHFEVWKDGTAQDPAELLPVLREAVIIAHADSLSE
jgi:murein DD-endopeptidase MepM/ murein hydrolase activator NlpD